MKNIEFTFLDDSKIIYENVENLIVGEIYYSFTTNGIFKEGLATDLKEYKEI